MKHHTAAFPFRHLQYDAMTTSRGLLRLLLVTLCLSFAQPFAALAQTNAPAPLPPAAEEALNKGIIAARVPDYLLAIRYFEEARKLAPQAPVVFLNMGLAESRIPSRELRALAWFGAYLAAYSDAPNAAAVREQIGTLDVRNQSNLSRLIKTVQDAAVKTVNLENADGEQNLVHVAGLWAKGGDITTALKIADLIADLNVKIADPDGGYAYKVLAQLKIADAQMEAGGDSAGAQKTLASAQETASLMKDGIGKTSIESDIARAQAKSGDIAGAQKKIADLIQNPFPKVGSQIAIAEAQIKAGDIAGAQKTFVEAQKTTDLIRDAFYKEAALKQIDRSLVTTAYTKRAIAEAQIKAGDIAGAQKTFVEAQKTADLIQDAWDKGRARRAQEALAEALAKAGITNAPNSPRQSISATKPERQPAVTISDWLQKLDDGNKNNFCPLNTGPFLDLAGYLRSLPPSDNPQTVFKGLRESVDKIVAAKNVIDRMLKQQAKQ